MVQLLQRLLHMTRLCNLIPRVSPPGDGKRRDPVNEVDFVAYNM